MEGQPREKEQQSDLLQATEMHFRGNQPYQPLDLGPASRNTRELICVVLVTQSVFCFLFWQS